MQLLVGRYYGCQIVPVQPPGLNNKSAYAVALYRAAKFLFGYRKAGQYRGGIHIGAGQCTVNDP